MLPFSSTVESQISFIIDSLNASNYDSVIQDLCQFVEYGVDGSILLLKTCMNHVNIHEGHTDEDRLKLYMLSVIFRYLMDRPNFTTIICHSLLSYANESFLEDLSEALDLSFAERIGIGLALSDSEDVDLRSKGQNFSMVHIKNVCANPNLGHGVTQDQIQNIILFLHRNVGLSKHVDAFMQILSLLHLKEKTPLTLAPFLTTCSNESDSPWDFDLPCESNEHDFDNLMAEMQTEMNMADIFKELGYGCTLNDLHCKEILALFSPLNETVIARIIGTVVSTHTGLEDCQVTYATFCSALGKTSSAEFSCLNSWNINVLLDSIKQIAPGTNWSAVMDNLDYEGFYIPDERSFLLFMSIYRNACQEPFPLHAACGFPWKNAEGQLSFLRYAVSAAPEIFTFSHSARILSYFDPAQANKISQVCPNQSWLCLDLLQILCELAERGHSAIIRTMLEYPLQHLPEALLVGLAHVNTAFNLIQNDVSSAVFPRAFENSSRKSTLHALWRTNPNLVMRGFIDMQSIEPDSSSKILDICHELKILAAVLDMSPFSSSIKLAALAAKKEYLHLENWLSEMMKKCKDTFFEECLKFLKERVLFDASSDMSSGLLNQSVISLNVSPQITNVFFKVLQFFSGQVSHQLSDELRRLRATTTHGIPRSQTGVSESSMPEDFPEDIEAEANSFYQQLFVGQLSMDAIVQMLTRFKESSDEREQSIFDCMIHNLFDEYKYFHRYPERQLKITAVLFGSLIKHKLVSHLILGIALRVVLDSLRKSIDSKMFLFGLTALEQFMDRLEEWPGFCNNILQISHLRGANGELVSFIERALARVSSRQSEAIGGSVVTTDQLSLAPPQDPSESNEAPESPWPLNGSSGTQLSPQHSSVQPVHQRNQGFADDPYKTSSTPTNYGKPASASSGLSSSISSHTDQKSSQLVPTQQTSSATTSMLTSPGFQRPTRSATPGGFGSALNIGTLVAAAERRETPIQAPPEEVHDKIFFLINNISLANLETKAREFTEMLKEEYYPWFALYIVMKRASIEPNFHDLYLKFLDKINSRELNKEIVKATYENCKVLLRSELIKSSSEERSLLKNLGSWLGKFTIGRNQTLRAKEIDPKALIIEAYEKGLMIAVIPFTSKILEPCATSLAYQPPNPWTMGVLGLLVEIYALPNLKMNLKFDIEVLFKNLKMELKDVIPTSLLKDRVRDTEGNPDFSTKDLAATQHQVVADINPGLIASLSQVDLPAEVIAPTLSGHANYTAPIHLTSSMLGDDDKLVPIGLPEHLPSGQGLSQVAQVPYSADQLVVHMSSFGTQVVVSPKLSSLGQSLPLSRLVQVAMERAINEILLNVVNRSVSIASMTTKELVSKDYAMEADESRMRNAANMMIASLAASLAHVACKDTLRQGIANHLRSYLQSLNISNEVLEQTVQILANDNLDLGCACVENMATEKALQKLEGDFPELVAMRRKQREGLTAAYFEATSYAQGFLACLPESLRPKPGRLTAIQHRVYEDFARWQHQPTQGLNNMPAATNQLSSAGGYVLSSLPHGYAPSSGQMTSSVYTNTAIGVGFGFNPQHLRHTSDDMDLSVPPGRSGAIEGAVVDMTSVASPLITAAESNARATDSSATVKDPGSSQQPPPSPATADRIGASILEPMLTTGDALEKYELIAQKMELLLLRDALDSDIKAVIAEVPEIILRCLSRDEAALAIAQKVFRNLYDSSGSILHLTYYLSVLVAIRDVSKLVVKELTSWVIYSDEDRKYNKDIVIGLICSELLNLAEYDMYLAKLIDGGRNKPATEFAISLIQTLVSQEPGQSLSEFRNLVDTFAKLATRPGSPESLQKLVETIRNLSNTVLGKDDKARLFSDKKASSIRVLPTREEVFAAENSSVDPPGFRDQVLYWFTEWARICDTPGISDAAYLNYITQLQQGGMLKDDVSERFFRVLLELAVAHCLNKDGNPASSPHWAPQQVQNLSFAAIDMLAKLVFLLVKFSAADQGATKVSLLSKVLNVSVRTLQKDAEEREASFNHRPFFRLFMNWIYDFSSADPSLDSIYFQVLTAFASTFHALQPLKVPGFSYAWLELVSHRCFMPRLLNINYPKGSPLFQRLLVDLFKFLEPYLRNAELGEPVQMLYKGTLRVLLVLLHDFPDFLCEYHFSFCDVIPPSCIQMRNVILSAFPPNMRLPDPFMPNLKVDLLPEISRPPKIQSDVEGALKAKQMKAELDDYLKTRQAGSTFLMDLKQRLLLPPSEASVSGTRYNVSLINSLVLYVGMQEIHQMQSMATPRMTDTASSDIFQKLIVDLDTEGRYLFLNAIANQLRYPNNHTHFFSCVLLYLFGEATQDIIQEQITRVLLERLIVNRPHPWGLLITFIELIKNPAYRFWNRPFTRCAPEIEKLFEQVSKSCGGPMRSVEDALVSGSVGDIPR